MDNPYSPYVDRTGGNTSWGANPTAKRGPQYFPPLPSFKPYDNASAQPGIPSLLSNAISRLRSGPVGVSSAGSGSGASGRGAGPAGMSVQGIAGIQGIPTLGGIAGPTAGIPAAPSGSDPASGISPDSPDQAPDTTSAVDSAGNGTVTSNPVIARLRGQTAGNGVRNGQRGPQY